VTKSNSKRQKEYRDRIKNNNPNPRCDICGVILKSEKTKNSGICSNCYPLTPEGIEDNRQRQIKHVKKRKQQN
jgi:hypothetical protein